MEYVYIWSMCDPVDCSPSGLSVRGIFQARTLEWVAVSFSRGSSRPRDWTQVSCVSCIAGRFFTTVPPGKPRGDVDRPPLGCPPTPITVWSTDGEGDGWQSQNRAGSSSVYRKFSFTCHIKGDPRLHWGNENESSGTHSQAGTRASSFGVWALSSILFTKNWGRSGLPLRRPPVGRWGHSCFQCPPLWQKAHWFKPRQLLGGLSSFLSFSGSPRSGGWIRKVNTVTAT